MMRRRVESGQDSHPPCCRIQAKKYGKMSLAAHGQVGFPSQREEADGTMCLARS